MPKIIPTNNTWKQVSLPGNLADDQNFQFLGSFEEIIPSSNDVFIKKSGEKIVKKPKKRKLSEKQPKQDKKKVKSDVQEANLEEKSSTHSEEGLKDVVENSSSGEKLLKKKKKAKKAPKKGKKSSDPEESPQKKPRTDDTSADTAIDMSAWTSFGLPEEILRALTELEFMRPTKIQELTIPTAFQQRKDVLGAAETGSGKTLAFAIPTVAHLLTSESTTKAWKALVLAPTRELVVQVRNHIDNLIKHTQIKATSIVGGLSQQKQERLLKSRPEIIVATPGRLWAMLETAENDTHLGDLSELQFVIIDEIDRMVEKGHFDELELILSRIRSYDNPKRQTMVFSATLTYVHPPPKRLESKQAVAMTADEKIKRLVQIAGLRKQHSVIDITKTYGTPDALIESRMNCTGLLDKDSKVAYLLKRYPGRTLIFTNSIDASRRLHGILTKLAFNPSPLLLHAKMIQKQRLKNLERFANTPNSILISTDVAARGLDIKGVENVVHYQVPKTAENYVHRSGRTARASNRGLTVLMVDPTDVQFYRRICRNLNREADLPILMIDAERFFEAVQTRVELASELELTEHHIKKATTKEQWFNKAASQADIEVERSEYEAEVMGENMLNLRKKKKRAEAILKSELTQPLPKLDGLGTAPELANPTRSMLFKKK